MVPKKNTSPPHLADAPVIGKDGKARAIAARLGVCSQTIFRWADDGKLRRYKINARVVLFDEREVSALLSSSRVG